MYIKACDWTLKTQSKVSYIVTHPFQESNCLPTLFLLEMASSLCVFLVYYYYMIVTHFYFYLFYWSKEDEMMILFLVCDGDSKVFLICKDFNVTWLKVVWSSLQTCEFMSYSIYYLKHKTIFEILSFLVYVLFSMW